jgi:hypothetical protein
MIPRKPLLMILALALAVPLILALLSATHT